jgi:hypothetical protein
VALGDDFAENFVTALLIGAEMGKRGIAAQQLAIVHAHDAAAERIVHAILDLVEPVQQRRCPRNDPIVSRGHSTAQGPEPAAFRAGSVPFEILHGALVLFRRGT